MSIDELNSPLGLPPGPGRKPGVRLRAGPVLAFAGIVAVAGGVVWLVKSDDGMGGRARAVAKIERPVAPQPAPLLATAGHPGSDGAPTGSIAKIVTPRRSGTDVENASGVRVVRQGGGDIPGALILQIPDAPKVGLTPAPDARLVQRSRFGLLPVEGSDGAKPYEIYARPIVTSGKLKPSAPKLALVIGGMGLNSGVTQAAIGKLPAAVTLAFAPYGDNLNEQAARAREDGHEIVLQVPMEPFDLAGPGPGPHMLRTGSDRKQIKENLHWHMGRFTGYIGIGNFLGAKFTSDAGALGPVVEEIRSRGLMLFDDGSSPRSLSGAIAGASNTPFVKADIILDEARDGRAVIAALDKLHALAVRQGTAVGFANGLPVVVEAVARFASRLEKRGIALVPLSALIGARPATAAKQ